MVAENDPAILLFVAVDARDDVPDLADLVIHVSLQTDLNVVRPADVIRERQTTLKSARSEWSFQLQKNGSGNVVSDRLHRQAREIGCFFGFQTRNTGNRWPARCQRIAWIIKQILDRAALA